jgi:hypothetical protein
MPGNFEGRNNFTHSQARMCLAIKEMARSDGWLCHLIGTYSAYLSIRSQKQRSDGKVPIIKPR